MLYDPNEEWEAKHKGARRKERKQGRASVGSTEPPCTEILGVRVWVPAQMGLPVGT